MGILGTSRVRAPGSAFRGIRVRVCSALGVRVWRQRRNGAGLRDGRAGDRQLHDRKGVRGGDRRGASRADPCGDGIGAGADCPQPDPASVNRCSRLKSARTGACGCWWRGSMTSTVSGLIPILGAIGQVTVWPFRDGHALRCSGRGRGSLPRYLCDPIRPWIGVSPLQAAALAGRLSAETADGAGGRIERAAGFGDSDPRTRPTPIRRRA